MQTKRQQQLQNYSNFDKSSIVLAHEKLFHCWKVFHSIPNRKLSTTKTECFIFFRLLHINNIIFFIYFVCSMLDCLWVYSKQNYQKLMHEMKKERNIRARENEENKHTHSENRGKLRTNEEAITSMIAQWIHGNWINHHKNSLVNFW